MTDRTRRLVLPFAAFLFGLVALGIAAVLTLTPQGREVAASDVGGPFTLVDHDGRAVTQADFAGEPHLVFFGFTHCPDVCPTKLFEIAQTLDEVKERSGRDIRALFVTVDPERDTPEIMKSYVSSFDDRILGLTGSPEQVAQVVSAYRAFARKVPLDGEDYTMEHTAIVYIMDEQGRFVAGLNTAQAPEDVAQELLARI
ncbi:SCO family protein [Salinarimonas ramus]|uniref:Copper-binding protein n=1 Tax=Salinarimonas ramus TaxID=690164 RepID=A0A917Q695_9HYPH|nr:SCO family protein [Salinarimonas ramus]GGK29017.1 copper-binding protein [Salinarimonas ramus]